VATTVTERAHRNALHLRYEEATYSVNKLSRYFTTLDDAWPICRTLAICRLGEAPSGIPAVRPDQVLAIPDAAEFPATTSPTDPTEARAVDLLSALRASVEAAKVRRGARQALIVEYLHLNSPLEITLAAAGSAGLTLYALYLLSAVLRDPERIGSWLPRLTAGWHKGWREAEKERRLRQDDLQMIEKTVEDQVPKLIAISENLADMKAADVTVLGDSETPEDIAKVLESD
jgi:hypothetical protein